jgi:hypothetical protein
MPDTPKDAETNEENRTVHAPDAAVEIGGDDPNRMLSRRSPVGRSASGLVSRDYQPRTGGPELVTSWPLGPAPSQTGADAEDWTVSSTDPAVLQRNVLQLPYLGPIDNNPLYLNAMGTARVDANETLTLELTNRHLSGEPYETTVELTNDEREPFVIPMVEVALETDEHGRLGKEYGGYELRATVSGGTAAVDPGTAVQLWSE